MTISNDIVSLIRLSQQLPPLNPTVAAGTTPPASFIPLGTALVSDVSDMQGFSAGIPAAVTALAPALDPIAGVTAISVAGTTAAPTAALFTIYMAVTKATLTSAVIVAATNVNASCPPAAQAIQDFQTSYDALNAFNAINAPIISTGVYDDATVQAIYATLKAVAKCPSATLIALARAVVADTTICAMNVNTNVQAFMNSYSVWKNPAPLIHIVPPSTYTAEVQIAVNNVLGGGSAVVCPPVAVPAPAPAPAPITITTAAPATSNTMMIVGGVVAVGAIGLLAYLMATKAKNVQH